MFNYFDRIFEYSQKDSIALISKGIDYPYSQIIDGIKNKTKRFTSKKILGKVIVLHGDSDFETITTLFALLRLDNVVLILTEAIISIDKIVKLVKADIYIKPNENIINEFGISKKPQLIQELINDAESGLILLSSGTTGKPKAILHSVNKLFQKYEYSRKSFKTLAFLLFDHIAGLDTMLYTFSAAGTLITLDDRSPEEVINKIKEQNIEVLPTSPSFLNILLLYPEFAPQFLSELKIITFGSERITDSTLGKLKERFTDKINILQKYGLTEMGSPQVSSKPDDPLWIKIDQRSTKYKIEDNILYLHSKSSMLGYIFEDHCEKFDGWYNTQDKVEVDGEWLKILGRTTDIINVGGQKVYPAEVESVLLEIDNIKEASVFAVENSIMGRVVGAKLELLEDEKLSELKNKIRSYCKDKLEPFKVPVSIQITKSEMVSDRFKKVR